MALSQSEAAVAWMSVGLTRSLTVSGWLSAKTLVETRGIIYENADMLISIPIFSLSMERKWNLKYISNIEI